MDRLTSTAINWARKHIELYGDTDILPVPFEFEAIGAHWPRSEAFLSAVDLDRYEGRPHLNVLAPKTEDTFRVATQLDPLDALVFAALGYEMAGQIESARVPIEERVSCSYRVDLRPEGHLFRDEHGWPDYHAHSSDAALDLATKHVVVADIADFYNQLYHHRIQNALDGAGVPPQRAKNVEQLLGRWTAKQSRGVPVGPSTSILLAESALNDVDNFLRRRGYRFTRYVDDFRIFVGSRADAIHAVHDLTRYLYTGADRNLRAASLRRRVLGPHAM